MKKIFLFNGPPGSGKDTASVMFKNLIGDVYHYKMAYPLKESCHKMLGLIGSLEELEPIKEKPLYFHPSADFIANNKNLKKPLQLYLNAGAETVTDLRQFYIHLSENVMKPMFGDDIFGQLAVRYVSQNENKYVTISDCGFAAEVQPLIEYYGESSFTLVKIYREGKTFANDSRNYIDLPNVHTFEIQNNGTMEELEDKLRNIAQTILGREF